MSRHNEDIHIGDLHEEVTDLDTELADLQTAVEEAKCRYAFGKLNAEAPQQLTILRDESLDAQAEVDAWHRGTSGDKQSAIEDLRAAVGESVWEDQETLVHCGNWVDYVKELVVGMGDLPKSIPSYIEIDWEATAENIRADYSEVDYLGETYYYRE